jgi:hypothetical protein
MLNNIFVQCPTWYNIYVTLRVLVSKLVWCVMYNFELNIVFMQNVNSIKHRMREEMGINTCSDWVNVWKNIQMNFWLGA